MQKNAIRIDTNILLRSLMTTANLVRDLPDGTEKPQYFYKPQQDNYFAAQISHANSMIDYFRGAARGLDVMWAKAIEYFGINIRAFGTRYILASRGKIGDGKIYLEFKAYNKRYRTRLSEDGKFELLHNWRPILLGFLDPDISKLIIAAIFDHHELRKKPKQIANRFFYGAARYLRCRIYTKDDTCEGAARHMRAMIDEHNEALAPERDKKRMEWQWIRVEETVKEREELWRPIYQLINIVNKRLQKLNDSEPLFDKLRCRVAFEESKLKHLSNVVKDATSRHNTDEEERVEITYRDEQNRLKATRSSVKEILDSNAWRNIFQKFGNCKISTTLNPCPASTVGSIELQIEQCTIENLKTERLLDVATKCLFGKPLKKSI